ncbi:MAG: hypothetical protein NTV80_10580 [Verrucomicrobia bacterium]|nr:hypothetical protein [Verrucomicrobiota bacterium]
MPTTTTCMDCGSALPADAQSRICGACLWGDDTVPAIQHDETPPRDAVPTQTSTPVGLPSPISSATPIGEAPSPEDSSVILTRPALSLRVAGHEVIE